MPRETENSYALILAGGSGTRFWPVSRDRLPKQLLRLFGEETLLEATIDRVSEFLPRENILILTNEIQVPEIRRLLPGFPEENIIAEPEKRDTAPAIALGIGLVAARCPEASMVVLPSDHLIRDKESFIGNMRAGLAIADDADLLLTVGIRPTWPCPGYGYLELGEPLTGLPAGSGTTASRILRFTEKPDPATAQGFLDTGNYLWNAGMFIWSIPSVRNELESHCPELAAFVSRCAESGDVMRIVASDFGSLPKLSIDYALMERSSKVGTIEASFDWDDVGSWPSVAKHLDEDSSGNRSNREITQVDSTRNIAFSDGGRRIALLGVDDLIVVETNDAILVSPARKEPMISKKWLRTFPKISVNLSGSPALPLAPEKETRDT